MQSYYSIAGRDLEREIVPLLDEEKLGLMVWSPLAGGLLSGKYGPGAPGNGEGRRAEFRFPAGRRGPRLGVRRRDARDRRKHGVSVATVALAWVLAKPFVMSVIIGANRMEQLDENLAATELTLDADELARLDEVSALPPEYPGWMLERQAAGRAPGTLRTQRRLTRACWIKKRGRICSLARTSSRAPGLSGGNGSA